VIGDQIMKLIWDKEQALNAANQLLTIQQEHEANVTKMKNLMNHLKEGWIADSAIAYEECFTSMTSTFNKYSQLLQDYSSALKRVTNNTFQNDSEHASQIYANFQM
jgi:WXG100 family type VII secretion target